MKLAHENRFSHEMIETFKDGELIFEEGDIGRDLYIVQSGEVRIVKSIDGKQIELVKFKKGDFFGDMALLQSIPRYASAYSLGETRLLMLKPGGFLIKIRRDPTFAFEMLQQLSLRIKVSNDRTLAIIDKFNLPKNEVQIILQALDGQDS